MLREEAALSIHFGHEVGSRVPKNSSDVGIGGLITTTLYL